MQIIYASTKYQCSNTPWRFIRERGFLYEKHLLSGFSVELFMTDFRIMFGQVDRTVCVMRRCIEGVHLEKFIRWRIYDVVLDSCGDHDTRPTFYRRAISIDDARTCPWFDTEKLIMMLVDLFTDLLARCEMHDDKLHMLGRVEYRTEVRIGERECFDVCDESFHGEGEKNKNIFWVYSSRELKQAYVAAT